MNAGTRGQILARILVLGILALPVTGVALESGASLRVQVFPDHYALAGKRFADLATLEAWVEPLSVQALRLDSCGQASVTRLVAAMERFYGVYGQGIEIREQDPSGPDCASNLATDAEFLEVEKNGRSILP